MRTEKYNNQNEFYGLSQNLNTAKEQNIIFEERSI